MLFRFIFITISNRKFWTSGLEAMSFGVPVISSNTGGIPEVNKHGVSGYLSDVGDIVDMTKNALTILSDEVALKTFKSNAKKESLRFDIHEIVPQYEAIYKETLTKCILYK